LISSTLVILVNANFLSWNDIELGMYMSVLCCGSTTAAILLCCL